MDRAGGIESKTFGVSAPREGPGPDAAIRAQGQEPAPVRRENDGDHGGLRAKHVWPRRAEWPEGHVDSVRGGEPSARWGEGHGPRVTGVALLQHQRIRSTRSHEIEQIDCRVAALESQRVNPTADRIEPGADNGRQGLQDPIGLRRSSGRGPYPDLTGSVAGRHAGGIRGEAQVGDVGLLLHDQARWRAPVLERSKGTQLDPST